MNWRKPRNRCLREAGILINAKLFGGQNSDRASRKWFASCASSESVMIFACEATRYFGYIELI